jgi:hypothetical protein
MEEECQERRRGVLYNSDERSIPAAPGVEAPFVWRLVRWMRSRQRVTGSIRTCNSHSAVPTPNMNSSVTLRFNDMAQNIRVLSWVEDCVWTR